MGDRSAAHDEAGMDLMQARLEALAARLDEQATAIQELRARVGRLETTAASTSVPDGSVPPPMVDTSTPPIRPDAAPDEGAGHRAAGRALHVPAKLFAVLAAVFLGIGLLVAVFELPVRVPGTGITILILIGSLCAATFLLLGEPDAT